MTYTCRWGILATGGIAELFAKDLVLDPKTRNVEDVRHCITAIASSSSKSRAEEFSSKVGADKQRNETVAATYGNYEDLVKDQNVDIIYVATPHSHHFRNVLQCLNAGKHVCCEKSFTVNESQAQHLVKLAKKKNLFLMEAVWIRFFPLMIEIKELLHKKRVLGKILFSQADFGVGMPKDPQHRINNPDLAGGALLDLGIYPLTWQLALINEDPDNKMVEPKIFSGVMKGETGVDAYTTMIFNWPALGIQTLGTTNMNVQTHNSYSVLVQGEKGNLTIDWPTSRPEGYSLHFKDGKGGYREPEVHKHQIPGQGMFWEADGCARALRDGKIECDMCPLSTTLLSQKIMEKIRKDADFRYPEELETTCDAIRANHPFEK